MLSPIGLLTGCSQQAQLDEHKAYEEQVAFDPQDPKLSVTIRPMELRTFYVTWKRSVEVEGAHGTFRGREDRR